MLRDAQISGRDGRRAVERRRAARASNRGEVVVQWHHDADTSVRYRLLDIGEGGMRILSSMPLLKGMSGTAVKLLPGGRTLHSMCTVSWVRPSSDEEAPFEIGLRFG